MNAIDRAGIDGFLNTISANSVLANGPGSAKVGLHHERVAGHMGAVAATDAHSLINPDGFFPKDSTEYRLPT